MKTRSLIAVLLAVALIAPLAFSAAEDTGPGAGPGPRGPRGEGMGMGMGEGNVAQMLQGRMAEELNLTEEQKTSIQKIADDSREAVQANREAVRTAMQNLNDAADKGDEAAATAAGKAAGDALTKQAIQRAQIAKKVNAILTEEQRTKLEQLRVRMREQMQQRRERIMQGEGGRVGRGPAQE